MAVTGGRVNSSAYVTNRKPDNEISVDLARLTTPEATLRGRPDFGIGSILAGAARRLEFDVVHDPLEDNPAHTLIRGENSRLKCRLLAEETIVIRPPRSS